MKNLLITITYNRMIRFFADTYLFDDIYNYCQEYGINVFVIMPKKEMFDFGNKNITVLEYPEPNLPTFKGAGFLRGLIDIPLTFKLRKGMTKCGYIQKVQAGKDNVNRKVPLRRIVFNKLIFFAYATAYKIPLFAKIAKSTFHDKNYDALLQQHKIDWIITTCQCMLQERVLAKSAEKLNIPVIAGNDGWDIFSGWSHPFSTTKCALVWGDCMARHAEIQGFKKERIVKTGIPYQDNLKNCMAQCDKDAIRTKYGFSKEDKIIAVFGTQWRYNGDYEKSTMLFLLDLIKNDASFKDYRILFRHCPTTSHEVEEFYKQYENDYRIKIQRPDNKAFNDYYSGQAKTNAFMETAEIFSISEFMISILSMCTLESTLAGTPAAIMNYQDIYSPTDCVSHSYVFKDLVNAGMPALHSLEDLRNAILTVDQWKNYIPKVQAEWSSKDENYVEKIFSLLEEK